MVHSLEKRVAIVTGAGRERGFGQAIAKRLASEGARVVIVDIGKPLPGFANLAVGTTAELEARAEEIRAQGGEVVPVLADISLAEDVERMVEETVRRFGQINILVNNAGVGMRLAPSLEWTQEQWDTVFAINVRGTWLCCKAVAKRMVENKWPGKIVNMSSEAARRGSELQPAYNASKAAILSYTQSLALELARHGINVNSVCPGVMDTQLTARAVRGRYEAQAPPGMSFEQFKNQYAQWAGVPMGRMGTAEEVADLVAFLVSEQARYITGQAININGGHVMS